MMVVACRAANPLPSRSRGSSVRPVAASRPSVVYSAIMSTGTW
jgi:hypothetical protein